MTRTLALGVAAAAVLSLSACGLITAEAQTAPTTAAEVETSATPSPPPAPTSTPAPDTAPVVPAGPERIIPTPYGPSVTTPEGLEITAAEPQAYAAGETLPPELGEGPGLPVVVLSVSVVNTGDAPVLSDFLKFYPLRDGESADATFTHYDLTKAGTARDIIAPGGSMDVILAFVSEPGHDWIVGVGLYDPVIDEERPIAAFAGDASLGLAADLRIRDLP